MHGNAAAHAGGDDAGRDQHRSRVDADGRQCQDHRATDAACPMAMGSRARRTCAPSRARTPHAAANIQPVAGLNP